MERTTATFGKAERIWHLRFHGRGGMGVKLASRIVSRAAFLAGREVQDSPLYGAERRGAPVVAFARFGDSAVRERGYIQAPDALVVLDETLLGYAEAGVLEGVDAATLVLVNSAHAAAELAARHAIAGRTAALDVSAIALAELGRRVLSAPMAAFAVKSAAIAAWEVLERAVRVELADGDATPDMIERNVGAARRAFAAAPALGLREPMGAPAPPPARAFVMPRLPAAVAAPSVAREATSAARSIEGWRVERPVIHLGRCTRCFFCFALCPEGAIALDADAWPSVDYDHCKGCLVCVHECPTHTIEAVREVIA